MDQITSSSASYHQQRVLIHQQQQTQQQQLYNFPQQQLSPISVLGNSTYFAEEISPTLTSPSPTSASTGNWPSQRTSNTRDELHSRAQQPQQYYTHQVSVKREPMSDKSSNGLHQGPSRGSEDPMPSTSDFVKKLYK